MYMTSEADLKAAVETIAAHCRPGGAALVVPDVVRETFEPLTTSGGHDAADGRALRMMEWHWDPDPTDETYQVEFSILLRSEAGAIRSIHEQHTMGLFSRSVYWRLLEAAGFTPIAIEQVLLGFDAGEMFLTRRA